MNASAQKIFLFGMVNIVLLAQAILNMIQKKNNATIAHKDSLEITAVTLAFQDFDKNDIFIAVYF
jgi:hypothetical protein